MTTGIDDAVELMQRALAHLDRAGETVAAAHLQGAIDAARKQEPLQFDNELDEARAVLIDESFRRQFSS